MKKSVFCGLFAVFMIPWIGKISDRQKRETGSRMKLIVWGLVFAGISFLILPLDTHNLQYECCEFCLEKEDKNPTYVAFLLQLFRLHHIYLKYEAFETRYDISQMLDYTFS